MRHKARAVAVGIVSAVTLLLAAPSASAATAPSGYACGYDGVNYNTSTYYCSAVNVGNWNGTGMQNKASSAATNGGSCDYTRYYKSWDYTTGAPYGDYFTLYSEQRLGYNYRDPDLSNGAGYDGAGMNFNNTVEATRFTGC